MRKQDDTHPIHIQYTSIYIHIYIKREIELLDPSQFLNNNLCNFIRMKQFRCAMPQLEDTSTILTDYRLFRRVA